MLLNETGYPLIWHTITKALESKSATEIILATDSGEIAEAVNDCMAKMDGCSMIDMRMERLKVIETPNFSSGTDRVEWVTQEYLKSSEESVINFQGDEPEFSGKNVDQLVKLLSSSDVDVATFAVPADEENFNDPNSVKVVINNDYNAMYFSRSPIPYGNYVWALIHIGIYAFKKEFLLRKDDGQMGWSELLERPAQPFVSENLEQLEWLQRGCKMKVEVLKQKAAGIDTREDYEKFVERINQQK
jgi:3-deoxy-manno-octulosonate cytidylyltransferase (CMP-KDO synthetase)